MIVRIAAGGCVSLDEAADCRRLSVVAADPAGAGAALAAAGAGAGHDEGHVQLDLGWLRAASAGQADPDAFDGMVEYATSRGWVTDDGSAVRAHIEQ